MSVAKLQVSLVRLVRSTMLELLPLCLFMDFCELTKPDSISPNQIGTPLRTLEEFTRLKPVSRQTDTFVKEIPAGRLFTHIHTCLHVTQQEVAPPYALASYGRDGRVGTALRIR